MRLKKLNGRKHNEYAVRMGLLGFGHCPRLASLVRLPYLGAMVHIQSMVLEQSEEKTETGWEEMKIAQIKKELRQLYAREMNSIPFLKKTQGEWSVLWAAGKAQGYSDALKLLETREKAK